MLRRVETLLSVDTRRLMGGTFHSVGNRLLRRFGDAARARLRTSRSSTRRTPGRCSRRRPPTGRSRSLERRFPKGDVLLDLYSYTDQHRPAVPGGARRARAALRRRSRPRSSRVFQRYRERKRAGQRRATTTTCCSPGSGCSRRARRRPRSSRPPTTTSSWTSTRTPTGSRGRSSTGWRRSKRNVTVVGDDAQAIYSFRGASFENILGFPERYPGREDLPADAQLPLDAGDPRARQRLDRAQRAAVSEGAAAPRATAGPLPAVVALPDIPEQARFVGAAAARVARRGREAVGRRGALPRALPGAGAPDRADAARHPVRDPLGHALLRAAARQGRARVPAHRRQPEGRAVLEARAEALPARRGALGGGGLGGDRQPARSARVVPRARRRRGLPLGRGGEAALQPVPSPARRGSSRRRSARRPPRRSGPSSRTSTATSRAPSSRTATRGWTTSSSSRSSRRPTTRCRTFLEEVTLFNELSGEDVVPRRAGRRPRRALLGPPGQGARVEPRHRDGPLRGTLPELPRGRDATKGSRRSGGSSTSPSPARRTRSRSSTRCWRATATAST